MYGDPSTSAASSGASLTALQSHSLSKPPRSQSQSQSQPPPSSSYPSTSLPLAASSRTSPFTPSTLAPSSTTTASSTAYTSATVIAPPATSSSMAASLFYPTPQPIGPPLSAATPSHASSSFAHSFDRDAPAPIGTRQPGVDYAVLVQRLPPETTEQNLRVMCIFSDELLDVNMLGVSAEPDGNFCSAVLRFKSFDGAQEAQTILNGKKGMMVDHLGSRGPFAPDRNKSGPSSGASSTTSPGTTATQPPRFDGTFSPLEKTSPSINGNYVTGDFGSAKPNYNYKTFFSPQSPIGNHLSEQPRNTGKSLINDATDDDDTGDILQLPRAFGENGSVTAQRRATAPQIPILDRMASLSLNTGPANGAPSSQRAHGQPGAYQPHSAHPNNTMSPTAMNGTNGHYQTGPVQWRTHVPPPANPADMNPPCNTLYVGNLPMGSSEDELKTVFSRQRGYKRLCFRAKANGPMCFVEFDDISCATRALHDLYGYPLTTSVKGGIRLSFSKNPLGVRTPQPPGQGPSGPLAGPNGLMNHSTNGFASAGPPPGLTAPPGLNGGRTNGPYSASGVQNSSTPSSSYPPSTMSNGSANTSLQFGNSAAAPSYGGNAWGSSSYFTSPPISASNGVASPPLAGAPNGSASFNSYRRGQF
ncbi:rna binding protein [Diaporthe amygdali]|uniref:rna binding protein n=1 Tax=Phomopsis amygdali TaxID=1214568 RepID=UPI0022FEDA4E|nr:rna binding protein [Diaporthe amygdali]KAJ0123725.1 rna binding protein [Diaporthe amygdali]